MKTSWKFYLLVSSLVILTIFASWMVVNYQKNLNLASKNQYLAGKLDLPIMKEVDLKKYNGSDNNLPIYIGLNGLVYDVSSGRDFYKTDGPYHYLAGKDSSVELNLFNPKIITDKYKPVAVLSK